MTYLIIQLNGQTIHFFINDGKAAIVVSSRGVKVKRIKSFNSPFSFKLPPEEVLKFRQVDYSKFKFKLSNIAAVNLIYQIPIATLRIEGRGFLVSFYFQNELHRFGMRI